MRHPAMSAIAALFIINACALAQPGELSVSSDRVVAEVLVDQVAWLGDERGLVIGGWNEWPSGAMIVVAEAGKQAISLERAAAPRFALSPSRKEIAYWVATGAGWCQLAVVPLAGAPLRYVGEARQVDDAMQLAWPTEATLVALLQGQALSRAVALDAESGAERVLLEVEGGEWVRLRTWAGSDPIAVWAGERKRCFRLAIGGQTEEVSADADTERARPSAAYHSYFDSHGDLVVVAVKGGAPWRPGERATAACWSPDATTLFAARENALVALDPEARVWRTVFGSSLDNPGPAPRGMSCSGDGTSLAYWRPFGGVDQVRVVALARERVVIRAAFAQGVTATEGQRIFVATKLYADASGCAKEPVWATVKGEFAVRSVATEGDHVVMEAVSVGAAPGVLKRLTGLNTAPPSGGAGDSGVLVPLPGLRTWLQGTKHTGKVTGVTVEGAASDE